MLGRARKFGAARATQSAGGSFARLLKAGQWRFLEYQLFLDSGQEESQAVAYFQIEASDFEDLREATKAQKYAYES